MDGIKCLAAIAALMLACICFTDAAVTGTPATNNSTDSGEDTTMASGKASLIPAHMSLFYPTGATQSAFPMEDVYVIGWGRKKRAANFHFRRKRGVAHIPVVHSLLGMVG